MLRLIRIFLLVVLITLSYSVYAGPHISCSCDYTNGGYVVKADYSNPGNVASTYMSIYEYSETSNMESYCNVGSLLYLVLSSVNTNIENAFSPPVTGADESYICVMHSGDCGPALGSSKFTCQKPPAKSSISSIFTIFLPALLFFVFFLAIIIRLIRRNAYSRESDEPAVTQQPQATILHVPGTPGGEAYELSNIAAASGGGYPLIQMTNQNGQTIFIPQYAAQPSQVFTNPGMPQVVYVTSHTDPNAVGSAYPPIYVATNPMPPQY